jgi:hypothetical protein
VQVSGSRAGLGQDGETVILNHEKRGGGLDVELLGQFPASLGPGQRAPERPLEHVASAIAAELYVRVLGSDLGDRVGQQTAATRPWGRMGVHRMVKEPANLLQTAVGRAEPRDGGAGVALIALEDLQEEGLLVTEAVVEALTAEAEMGLEIGEGGALVAALPEELDSLVEDGILVEGLGACRERKVTLLDRTVK